MNKKVLILVDWYLPGYKGGGQIKAVEYIVSNLKERFDFYILCRDHDFDGVVYPDLEKNKWLKFDNVHIKYLSNKNKPYIVSVVDEIRLNIWDVIYMNSFFSFFFSILPCAYLNFLGGVERNIILAPRGEFSTGALGIKKAKKYFFIIFSRIINLHKEITWHVSTELEKDDVQKCFPRAKVHIARELLPVAIQSNEIGIEKHVGTLKLLFLSRVTNKKGLDYALKVLGTIKSGCVELDIYGPIEDKKYWSECEILIETLPENIVVKYCGELPHNKIKDVIPRYHLLFFPTLGENFGYVIIETLLSCRPVLISDRTPWRDLAENKVGYDISLDELNLFAEKIKEFIGMDQIEFDKYIVNVNTYADKYVENQRSIVEDNIRLFSE
ncbi:glycosyltransferase [Collimonas sp.]|jgi:glycosyltransferase involved in cell wall biosynthesis|uniref:glycosyltransferase n=1 Tax=Collimonas sp. TaxID=1963772 RepID=UPI002B6338F3|nr:glycosyltransferase [Collimonas sp.]HWW04949.1 glycosyltransferase [Collimonas sp.]